MSSSEFKRFGEHSQANASAAQVLQQPQPARAGGLRIQNPPPTHAYTSLYAQRWHTHERRHAHTHTDVKKGAGVGAIDRWNKNTDSAAAPLSS